MNVKAGDLAIVVDDGGKFENVGLIVNVVLFASTMHWHEFGEQSTWLVEAAGPRGLCYERSDGELYFKRQGKVPDCCLRRIEPDQTEEDLFRLAPEVESIIELRLKHKTESFSECVMRITQ